MLEIPQDAEIERAVLGCLLLDGTAGRQSHGHEILDVEEFYTPENRQIFVAILELEEGGVRPDPLAVGAWLKQRGQLGEITRYHLAMLEEEACTNTNLGHWCDRLVEVGKHRTAAIMLARAADGFGTDPETATDRLVEDLSGLTARDREKSEESLDMVAYGEDIDARPNRPGGISTGIPDWDQKIGGLCPGMHIIAARPSKGKSALAITIARHVGITMRRPVALISMEMSRMQLMDRIVSAETGIPASVIKRGTFGADDYEILKATLTRIQDAPIYILDRGTLTVRELMGLCKQWGQRHEDRALIVVDYIQLATGRGDNREQEVASVSRCCKAIATDLHVAVLALSQLNRAVKDGDTPGLRNLRESGSLEQDADTVTFIHRDDTPPESEVAELIIAKNRDGPCGKVRVGWDASRVRFYELD